MAALVSTGPAAAQGLVVEVRGGMVASSPLSEDEIASPLLLESVDLGGREARTVTVRPALAPLVVLVARTGLKPRLALEAAGGWTFGELRGDSGEEEWTVQDLGVGHAVLALRYRLRPRLHVRGGLGAIRYAADQEGIFQDGSELRPLLEVGAGTGWRIGGVRATLELTGQAHAFATPAMRREGAVDGTVYRAALLAGVVFGAEEP